MGLSTVSYIKKELDEVQQKFELASTIDTKLMEDTRSLLLMASETTLKALRQDLNCPELYHDILTVANLAMDVKYLKDEKPIVGNAPLYKQIVGIMIKAMSILRCMYESLGAISKFGEARATLCSYVYDTRRSDKAEIAALLPVLKDYWDAYHRLVDHKLITSRLDLIVSDDAAIKLVDAPTVEPSRDMIKAVYDLSIANNKALDCALCLHKESVNTLLLITDAFLAEDLKQLQGEYNVDEDEPEDLPEEEEEGDSFSCGTK